MEIDALRKRLRERNAFESEDAPKISEEEVGKIEADSSETRANAIKDIDDVPILGSEVWNFSGESNTTLVELIKILEKKTK